MLVNRISLKDFQGELRLGSAEQYQSQASRRKRTKSPRAYRSGQEFIKTIGFGAEQLVEIMDFGSDT